MRKWMDKMERKFGRYAVKNLTVYLLVCYGVGYLLSFLSPQLLSYFTLEPGLILQGQIWRLISWVIIPPNFSLIFVIFMMLLYYSLGTSLETIWGSFRYNGNHFHYYRRIYRVCYHRRYGWFRRYFQYVLYQYVYFLCMCGDHAGSAALSLWNHSGEDEVAGYTGRSTDFMGFCGRRNRYQDFDSCIAP